MPEEWRERERDTRGDERMREEVTVRARETGSEVRRWRGDSQRQEVERGERKTGRNRGSKRRNGDKRGGREKGMVENGEERRNIISMYKKDWEKRQTWIKIKTKDARRKSSIKEKERRGK